MAVFEILFDVNGGPEDGMPLAIAPLGLRFTPAQWASYRLDGTDTPTGWGPRVAPDKKRAYGRLRGGINSADSGQTEEERRLEVYGVEADADVRAEQIDFLIQRMAQALEANTFIAADGEDTNWGFSDLRVRGTLLAELTTNDVVQMMMSKPKAVHPLLPQDPESRRMERIIYAPPVFSQSRVNRWRDPLDYVAVQRSMTPLLYSDTSWHALV